MKRVVSMVLAVAILVGMLPTTAWAAGDALSAGCCEHHQTHDDSCGYKAAVEVSDCTHQHTADCYEKETCIHTHGVECSVTCSHVCSTDTGCITMQRECTHLAHDAACGGLDEENPVCNHTCEVVVDSEDSCYALLCSHAEPDAHDEACGYAEAEAEKACEYICEECAMEEADAAAVAEVKALIDVIPALDVVQEMSQDEQRSVYEQTQAAYNAYKKLTKDQKSQISDANRFFEELFRYFNSLTSEVNTDSALNGQCGENVTWELDTATGTLVISGTGTMDNTWWPYETPSESPNFAPWHDNAANIKSVVINSGVTSIGHFAFFDCVNLTNVSIPEGVTFIGCAFVGCDSLEELYIPASVTDFRYPSNEGVCTGLTKIVVDVSNSVYSSDEAGMLYNKDKTKFIGCPTGYQGAYTIADSVIEIGDWAFYACTGLTSVDVPISVTTIGISAFNSCAKLDGIVIPDGVTTIGMFTFAYCAGLTEITIPKNVTALGNGVFTECTALAEVRFEGDAPDIDYECFNQTSTTAYYPAGNSTWTEGKLSNYCGNIQWVEYADNVNQCGDELFWEFDADTKTLTISGKGEMYDFPDAGSPWYSLNAEIDHVVISEGATSIGNYAFVSCGMDDIEIPDSVTRIGQGAFALSRIESIKIPGSVTTIEEYTFTRSALNCIVLPEQLKVIEENAFAETPLTAIALPDTLTEIGAEAFWSTMLTSVAISENVSLIGAGAFAWCEDLTAISVTAGNANLVAKNGVLFDKNGTTLIQYPAKKAHETYAVPAGTSVIGAFAFSGVKALKQVELPGDLNSLEKCAFIGCSSLTEMNIPENVSSFGLGLFENCRDLKNITFTGDAPVFAEHWISEDMNLTAYYPADNETWTDEVKQNYGGKITWVVSCDHSLGDWYETKEPTEEAEGEERRDCEKCDYYETRSAEKLPHEHEYTSKVTSPTCTEQGYTTYTCRCSDSYVDNYVSALNHSWGSWWEKTAPTCTKEGINQRDCQRSGCDAVETENIDSLGHSYGEWYETKAPTKDEEGEERRDCIRGDHYETRQIEKLPVVDIIASGACGENLTWTLDDEGTLTISGNGEIPDYTYSNGDVPPWYNVHDSIKVVVIREGVTSIGDGSFMQHTNLTRVELARNITTIGNAFSHCYNLQSISIPESVESISEQAFYLCKQLTEIYIPAGVSSIGAMAFNRCDKLKTIKVSEASSAFSDLDGVLFDKSGKTLLVYPLGKEETEYTVPDGVTSIANYAFYYEDSLKVVVIPNSVQIIGDQSFADCNNLTQVEMSAGMTTIERRAFWGCDKLENIVLPVTVENIGENAFGQCDGLQSIYLPKSVNSFGNNIFYDCDKLANIYFAGTQSEWAAIPGLKNNDFTGIKIHYNSSGADDPILPLSRWQKAYYDFIVQNKENYEKHAKYKDWNDGVRYELLYIDNDDIPELFISYDEGCYYGDYGFIFVQYKEGKIECISESFGVATIEYLNKGSIYALKYYNNRYWFETVVSLENKESSTLGYSSNMDSDGNLGSTFEWNNKSVTEAKYNEKRNEVLNPTETATTLSDNSKIYNYNGILEYLLPKTHANYDSVLDGYRKVCAMDEDTFFEKYNKTEYPYTNRDVMVRYYMEGDKQFVYAYHDIDGNGMDELLIGYGSKEDIDIIGVYAFNGTEAVKLMFATGEKILLDVFEDGLIRQQQHESWNSTITEYYCLDTSGYKLMEVSAGSMAEIQNFKWSLLEVSDDLDDECRIVIPSGQDSFKVENGQTLRIPCMLYKGDEPVADWDGPELSISSKDVSAVLYDRTEKNGETVEVILKANAVGTAYVQLLDRATDTELMITVVVSGGAPCRLSELDPADFLAFSSIAYQNFTVAHRGESIKNIFADLWESPWDETDITYGELCADIAMWHMCDFSENKNNGFYAVAFENDDNEIVIAYRGSIPLSFDNVGSDLWNDWFENDFPMIIFNEISEKNQIGDAFWMYSDILEEFNPNEIVVTGHSLGGGLGNLVSARYGCRAETMNAISALDVMYYNGPEVFGENFNGVDLWNIQDHANEYDVLAGTFEEARGSLRIKPYVAYESILGSDFNFKHHSLSSYVEKDSTGKIRLTEAKYNFKLTSAISKQLFSKYLWGHSAVELGTSLNDSFALGLVEPISRSSYGGDGNDSITSSICDDSLIGGNGSDTLDGGWGNDKYIYFKGDGIDTIYDAAGTDKLYLYGFSEDDEIEVIGEGLGSSFIKVLCNGEVIVQIHKDNRSFSMGTLDNFTVCKDIGGYVYNEYNITSFFKEKEYDQRMLIACPVDIQIFDESGKLVYTVKDGTSGNYYTEYGNFYVFEEENSEYGKVLELVEGYSVRIVGVDTGSMDISYQDIVNGELGEVKTLSDVPVSKEFEATLGISEDGEVQLNDHISHTADTEWVSDGMQHWHTCTGCDEKLDISSHTGGTATCTKKAVCAVCGASYGELASHDYETSWSQGDANGHWHECNNCSAHDTQVEHTPGAAATSTTAQTCTVCGYVITPALGHNCTAGTKWYSNGTYHWHLCTSCGAWVKTSYHSYSGDTDETCNVCGYVRTVTATEPTQETEVAMTGTIEASVSDEEVIATDTVPVIVPTETNENLSDNAVSEDTDSRGVSGVLITVFAIVALGSLAALAILLVYKKRRKSE